MEGYTPRVSSATGLYRVVKLFCVPGDETGCRKTVFRNWVGYYGGGGMKMGFIFTEVFWGVLLILLGAAIVIKVVFNINIPIIRLLLAFILIYLGIRLMIGWGFHKEQPNNTVLFNDNRIEATNPAEEYNVIFGRGTIDLTKLVPSNTAVAKVNVIFGGGLIRIDPSQPVRIEANSAFGEARMPDGNNVTFGNYIYKTPSYQEGKPALRIEANAVFGALEIVER